jgi:hypothetical protein
MALIKRGTILRITKTAASATELLIDRPLVEESKVVESKNPEFLYFVAKAIAAGDEGPIGKNGSREPNYNGNADYFPKKEIESAYQTFIGKGIYLDHNASSVMYSVGKIMDAYPTVDPDNGEWSISCLAKIDRKLHPEIARKVETGELNTVSMGCSCGESKCSVCGTILRTDDDPKCEHLSPGKLMHDYTAEIDLPEFGIHKGEPVKSFAINSQINFNELSLVGVPAWPRAFVTTILSNLKSTISKQASLTKEEQLDLVAQFEKLVDTLDVNTKEQVKAEFCGCPIVKENNMSDTPQKQSNDEVTDLLKKVSAYEMEKLENYIQHKTRKAEATAAADTKTNDGNWMNSILEKAKNTAAGKVFARTIQRLAEEDKETPEAKEKHLQKEREKQVGEFSENYWKGKNVKHLSAIFTANKAEPMKSSWALLDENDKVILDASLHEIWGDQFEANQDFAISEEYGRAIAARFLDPKLGGIKRLANLWDVEYKLNKEANMEKTSEHGEFFKAKDFFVPGSDSSNKYTPEEIKHMSEKEHAEAPGKVVSGEKAPEVKKAAGHIDEKFDITEGKGKLFDAKGFFEPGSDSSNKWNDKRVKIEYTISKPAGEFFKPGSDSSNNYKATDVKMEYNIPGPGQEAGQKGPAAPKPAEVKTIYDFKKPEGEFVNTNKKTKNDEEHAKSEEKMKTGYKGDLMYDEEKKQDHGKKESALKTAGEVSHKVENGSNDNMLKNPKTSGDTPETSADGGSYVKSSKTVGESPESSVKGDVYPNKDPKTSGDEPASSYNKTAKTVGDVPEGSVEESQYPKASEPNKDPEASVKENNMPKGTPDLTKTPDSSVQEKMPAPAKSDKDPDSSVKDTKFEKHPDLTSKPETSSKEDQYPTPANPAKEPDSSYQKDSSLKVAKTPAGWEHAVRELKKTDVDNPWAVVNWMKNKGYTPHKKSELDLKADSEMCAKCAMPLHECACMAAQEGLPEAPKPEMGSAFDKVEDKLTIGDGYDASKDKETKEIVISKDGKEMKRLPDGFGADIASVTSLLKAVLGLPATEEKKDETLSPVEETVEKVEVHPEMSSPSETPSLKASALEAELEKKAAELKVKEEELNKKAEEIKKFEMEKQAAKFADSVASRTTRCRRVIEAMLEKNVLSMDDEVLKAKLQEGTYLLDARKAALDHAISAKLKELMASDDVALAAIEKTVNDIKLPEAEVSKKANRVPFVAWDALPTEENDIKAIFDQMGKRSHWNQ